MISPSEYKVRIDECLEELYLSTSLKAHRIDPLYGELVEQMHAFILRGGKRQRPYLAYLAYVGLGGENVNSLTRVAAGLEIFHNFLLIHDDVIDRDHVRYGGPNLTGYFYQRLRKLGQVESEASHFAEMAAVLAGDVASSIVRSTLYTSDFPAASKVLCSELMDKALFYVGGGEYLDALSVPLGENQMSYDRIMSVYEYKTARYTFDLPLQVGACLAGTKYVPEALTAFAVPLGVAFQMRDDYLGLFGDTATTGKPTLGDLREGKQTLLIMLAMELASNAQKEVLRRLYGLRSAQPGDLEEVKAVCLQSGACEAHESEIRRLVGVAGQLLPEIGFTEEVKAALSVFINASVTRNV